MHEPKGVAAGCTRSWAWGWLHAHETVDGCHASLEARQEFRPYKSCSEGPRWNAGDSPASEYYFFKIESDSKIAIASLSVIPVPYKL
jgi:hypothetical protein